jgi:hypothetical protein
VNAVCLCGVSEILPLLGRYAVQIRSFKRFETTSVSHIQGSSALPMKMGRIGLPKRPVLPSSRLQRFTLGDGTERF